MKLTALELKVLAALYESSDGNGHDFGFTEDARACVATPRALAGVVASLVKKNLIKVYEEVNGYHQFKFENLNAAERALGLPLTPEYN